MPLSLPFFQKICLAFIPLLGWFFAKFYSFIFMLKMFLFWHLSFILTFISFWVIVWVANDNCSGPQTVMLPRCPQPTWSCPRSCVLVLSSYFIGSPPKPKPKRGNSNILLWDKQSKNMSNRMKRRENWTTEWNHLSVSASLSHNWLGRNIDMSTHVDMCHTTIAKSFQNKPWFQQKFQSYSFRDSILLSQPIAHSAFNGACATCCDGGEVVEDQMAQERQVQHFLTYPFIGHLTSNGSPWSYAKLHFAV